MNRITVNHHPINYTLIGVFGAFIVAPLCLLLGVSVGVEAENEGLALVLVFGLILVYAGVFTLLNIAEATVEWDYKGIHIMYMKSIKNIRFEDIQQLSYTVYSENHGRGGKQQRLELRFILENEEYYLNDKLDNEDIGKVISGDGSFPLMKLYSFIESEYPEKAVGYKKYEGDIL